MKLKIIIASLCLIIGACASKHDIERKSKCACMPQVNYADINQNG